MCIDALCFALNDRYRGKREMRSEKRHAIDRKGKRSVEAKIIVVVRKSVRITGELTVLIGLRDDGGLGAEVDRLDIHGHSLVT